MNLVQLGNHFYYSAVQHRFMQKEPSAEAGPHEYVQFVLP